MTFFFLFIFGDQQKTRRKVDYPKNFGYPRMKFCPPQNRVLVEALAPPEAIGGVGAEPQALKKFNFFKNNLILGLFW